MRNVIFFCKLYSDFEFDGKMLQALGTGACITIMLHQLFF